MAVCGLEITWRVSGGCALSLHSLWSGEILGGEPHIAARLSQTRRWRPGEPEGPVQGGKHRAEVEPRGPGPLWVDAGVCQYPGMLGGWGGVGWAFWHPAGPGAGASRLRWPPWARSFQRTKLPLDRGPAPRATPPWGRGSESRGPLWGSRAERESLTVSQPGVWDFSSCCP